MEILSLIPLFKSSSCRCVTTHTPTWTTPNVIMWYKPCLLHREVEIAVDDTASKTFTENSQYQQNGG